jgi:hypothetical protein
VLDRQRERQLSRLRRRLNGVDIPLTKQSKQQEKVRTYYGFPYSYRGQFMPRNPK